MHIILVVYLLSAFYLNFVLSQYDDASKNNYYKADRKVIVGEEVSLECFAGGWRNDDQLMPEILPDTGNAYDSRNQENRPMRTSLHIPCKWSHYDVLVKGDNADEGSVGATSRRNQINSTRYTRDKYILLFTILDAEYTGIYLCTCGPIIRSRHDIVVIQHPIPIFTTSYTFSTIKCDKSRDDELSSTIRELLCVEVKCEFTSICTYIHQKRAMLKVSVTKHQDIKKLEGEKGCNRDCFLKAVQGYTISVNQINYKVSRWYSIKSTDAYNMDSYYSTVISYKCNQGWVMTFPTSDYCVACSPGSFEVKGKCKKCKSGSYQPDYASVNCIRCPSNSTTKHDQATNSNQCVSNESCFKLSVKTFGGGFTVASLSCIAVILVVILTVTIVMRRRRNKEFDLIDNIGSLLNNILPGIDVNEYMGGGGDNADERKNKMLKSLMLFTKTNSLKPENNKEKRKKHNKNNNNNNNMDIDIDIDTLNGLENNEYGSNNRRTDVYSDEDDCHNFDYLNTNNNNNWRKDEPEAKPFDEIKESKLIKSLQYLQSKLPEGDTKEDAESGNDAEEPFNFKTINIPEMFKKLENNLSLIDYQINERIVNGDTLYSINLGRRVSDLINIMCIMDVGNFRKLKLYGVDNERMEQIYKIERMRKKERRRKKREALEEMKRKKVLEITDDSDEEEEYDDKMNNEDAPLIDSPV